MWRRVPFTIILKYAPSGQEWRWRWSAVAWVKRLHRLSPVAGLSMELVKFDTRAMQAPETWSVEYRQGTLYGFSRT